jgi:hypothetical protein
VCVCVCVCVLQTAFNNDISFGKVIYCLIHFKFLFQDLVGSEMLCHCVLASYELLANVKSYSSLVMLGMYRLAKQIQVSLDKMKYMLQKSESYSTPTS